MGFAALRRAEEVSQVRALAALIHRTQPLSVVSSLLTIASGIYMLSTVWGWQTAWAIVTLGSLFVCLPPLLLGVIEPRTRTVLRLAREVPNGAVPAHLQALIHDRRQGTALQVMAAVILGIVFLITTKPGLVGALAVMLLSVGLGALSGLLLPRRPHPTRRVHSL